MQHNMQQNKSRPTDQQSKILIIDTETSGTNPHIHSLISLAVVPLIDGIQDGKEWFVYEHGIQTDPQAMSIHGIKLDWLAKHGIEVNQVCLQFEDYLSSYSDQLIMLAGHNVSFDIAFLKKLYCSANRTWPKQLSHRSIDTHSLLWFLAQHGKIPHTACSSDGAFAFFNCEPPSELRHSALGDAMATKKLLCSLLDIFNAEK